VKYDIEYFERMLRLNSSTAEEISKIRWDWIEQVDPKIVLDYGSGVGWFRAWRPKGVEVFSYDIGEFPQTGIPLRIYDVACFWDVFEHILDMREVEPMLALSKNLALTLPMKPEDKEFDRWKHFKPGEHLHYYTPETLTALFKRYGFMLKETGTPECPPREDVVSFLYGKERWKS